MIKDKPNRRGIALILVMMVIAIASVLGLAMISGSMLQKRIANNAGRAARADGMAESGMNLAMYYLANPADIPGGGSYWAGTGSSYVSFGSAAGSVKVTVTPAGTDGRTYEIVSIGKSSSDFDAISRTLQARVQSNKFVVRQGGMFTQAAILPTNTTIDGDVALNGKLTLSTVFGAQAASVVNGAGYCTAYQSLPNPKPRDNFKPLWTTSTLAPAAANVNKYATYTYNGATYSAEALGGSTLTSTTKSSSASNPLGVFYRSSGSTYIIGDNVTWNGTLVMDGNLSIQGTNITFNAAENMPAVVVTGWLEIVGAASRTITCNGVCYVGSQLRGNTLVYTPNTTFNVNGALIIASPTGTVPFNTNYKASTKIKFDPTKIRVNDLNTTITTPTSVSVIRWGPDRS